MRKTVITTEYSATLGAFLDSKDIEWNYKNNVITFTLPYMSPSAIFDFAVEFKDYQNKNY